MDFGISWMTPFFKKKELKPKVRFKPETPLTWWIDDLTHAHCGLVDCPERGLATLPWPDDEKVYLAIDKKVYDAQERKLKAATAALETLEYLHEGESYDKIGRAAETLVVAQVIPTLKMLRNET